MDQKIDLDIVSGPTAASGCAAGMCQSVSEHSSYQNNLK
jgi:hypothetical protein